MEQKHLCQQAGQFGRQKFKLETMGEGLIPQKSTKEVRERVGKPRAQVVGIEGA